MRPVREACLILEGAAGIGKSALLEAAIADAADAATRTARGSELEPGFPFGMVRHAVGRTMLERADLLTGPGARPAAMLAPEAPREAPAKDLLHGLWWLMVALAAERPLLPALDDLHGADAESIVALRYLALRVAGLRVAIPGATRPRVGRDALTALLGDPAVEICRPRPLSADGAAALLSRRLTLAVEPGLVETCRAAGRRVPFMTRCAA